MKLFQFLKSLFSWKNLQKKVFIGQGWLWFVFLLFLTISAIVVYSANSQHIYKKVQDGGSFFDLSHWIFLIGSIVVTLCFSQTSVNRLKSNRFQYILFGFIGILLVGLIVRPVSINQAVRWTNILVVTLQPSEFFKVFLIFLGAYLARFFHRRRRLAKRAPNEVQKISAMEYTIFFLFIIVSLYILCRDNMSLLVMLGLFGIIYSMTIGIPRIWGWRIVGIATFAAVLGLILLFAVPKKYFALVGFGRSETWKARIERSTTPEPDSIKFSIQDDNRQQKYALIAMARSDGQGLGPGQSKMRDLLPMASSDFVYAILVEEYGIFGLVFIPALYILFFVLAFRIARKEKDIFLRTLAIGIGLYYPMQALLNISVASGTLMTGQQMPFISVGGSGLIAASISMGILMSISRTQYLTDYYMENDDTLDNPPTIPQSNNEHNETTPQ